MKRLVQATSKSDSSILSVRVGTCGRTELERKQASGSTPSMSKSLQQAQCDQSIRGVVPFLVVCSRHSFLVRDLLALPLANLFMQVDGRPIDDCIDHRS